MVAKIHGAVTACIIASGGGAATCGGDAACIVTSGATATARVATNCNDTTTHVALHIY